MHRDDSVSASMLWSYLAFDDFMVNLSAATSLKLS
jgi:hypothetical protein